MVVVLGVAGLAGSRAIVMLLIHAPLNHGCPSHTLPLSVIIYNWATAVNEIGFLCNYPAAEDRMNGVQRGRERPWRHDRAHHTHPALWIRLQHTLLCDPRCVDREISRRDSGGRRREEKVNLCKAA